MTISLRIVLVQPRNPLNILAAARAARNFGLGDIAVVDVQQPAWEEALLKDVDRQTPHGPRATSRGWLGDARKFDTLLEAIGDCDLVLGTSSLERRRIKRGEVIALPELAARLAEGCGLAAGSGQTAAGDSAATAERGQGLRIASGRSRLPGGVPRVESGGQSSEDAQSAAASPLTTPLALHTTHTASLATPTRRRVAILFGSEKRGLANEHLMYCHHLLHIPTVDEKPSMNLGQAVAVVCYELARSGALGRAGSEGSWVGQAVAGRPGAGAGSEAAGLSGLSAAATASAGSAGAELPEVTEKSEEIGNAASVREKQALADQVEALLKRGSGSSEMIVLESERDESYRNLIKMLTRLPLTSEDVRRIIKLIKDARSANSETSERPRKPGLPRKP